MNVNVQLLTVMPELLYLLVLHGNSIAAKTVVAQGLLFVDVHEYGYLLHLGTAQ